MKETYVIYMNNSGEFVESLVPDSFGGEMFGTSDIDSALQFASCSEAQDFCDENLVDSVVLKWM